MDISTSVAVLGLGNILMQDDGVGCKAVETLAQHYSFNPPVAIIEVGTNPLSLSPWLTDKEHLIVVDAVETHSAPGTVVLFKLDPWAAPPQPASAHQLGLREVLQYVQLRGKKLPEVVVCGIQPFNASQPGLELTPDMRDCLPQLIDAVLLQLKGLGVNCQPAMAQDREG